MQSVLNNRYLRNKNTITETDQKVLHTKKVLIIGLGALGGFVFEQLTRIGVGHILGYDYDVFDATNLNRQRFANELTIGKLKADVVQQECRNINSELEIHCVPQKFEAHNNIDLLDDVDLVIDATDSISSKISISKACKDVFKPCIVGAIAGHLGQVILVQDDYDLVSSLYYSNDVGIESIVGNPIYTATIIASLMSKLSIDVLLAKNTSNDLHYVVNIDELEIIEIIKPQNKL